MNPYWVTFGVTFHCGLRVEAESETRAKALVAGGDYKLSDGAGHVWYGDAQDVKAREMSEEEANFE